MHLFGAKKKYQTCALNARKGHQPIEFNATVISSDMIYSEICKTTKDCFLSMEDRVIILVDSSTKQQQLLSPETPETKLIKNHVM